MVTAFRSSLGARCALVFVACGFASLANAGTCVGFSVPPGPVPRIDQGANYAIHAFGGVDLGFGDATPDILYFEFYDAAVGPGGVGTFDVGSGADSNYSTCIHCIKAVQDSGSPNEKIMFQSAGTLVVSTPPGGTTVDLMFDGTLIEVTIDPATFVSTPVPGGECYTTVGGEIDLIFASSFE